MKVDGLVRPPGDKSITHRALMLAALAPGESRLMGALTAADARSTAAVLRRVGARVGPLRAGAAVRVRGGRWHRPRGDLPCGNSGTTARLMLGLLAGHAFPARLTGDRSLRRRPMRRITDPLRQMGAVVQEENAAGTLPLTIRGGSLRAFAYESPVASAQVKTALLLAGVVGGVEVMLTEPYRSRDHTERLLAYLGYPVEVSRTGVRLSAFPLDPSARPHFELAIPGDPSSAGFLAVAAVLAEAGELVLEGVGTNPTRIGLLWVLERMGARIEFVNAREEGEEPVADLVVRPARLRGTRILAHEVPSLIDEVPILAVAAARAEGETVFEGVEELRVKESDRLELIAGNLRAVGVRAEASGNRLVVQGTDRPPVGNVDTGRDHRIAMAFAVLATVPGALVELSETRSVIVSYPTFFDDLQSMTIRG